MVRLQMLMMVPRVLLTSVSLVALMPVSAQQLAQSEGFDPLALQSAPVQDVEVKSNYKIFLEGAYGTSTQRYQPGSVNLRRGSLDINYASQVGAGLRFVLSDRVDYVHPTAAGSDSSVNSLREAYLSWQPDGGDNIFEAGRINLRYGPGFGYNPTDFFRDGSLRTITTANPFALRENRLGTVVLRGQHLWSGGSLAVAYSPKLATRASADGWSVDLGATNNRDRGVVVLGTQFSERISTQLLAYKEDGEAAKIGASLTALLSDAAVAHVEWSRGKESDLLSRALSIAGNGVTRNRFAGGLTYTTTSKLSLTAEYQYNGFGLDRAGWNALAANPMNQVTYLLEAQRLQDLAPRQAFLFYASQKDLGIKNLDLTAFLRVNLVDHSRLAWIELRHHWPSFDLAVQLQRNMGRLSSEYGILPDRRVIQILGTYYF
jgi:opacity protein-like surface antigen